MNDPINPQHYQNKDGYQVIDVIEAVNASFTLGTTLKYLFRAGKKDGNPTAQDLEKAAWNLRRELQVATGGPEYVLPHWFPVGDHVSRFRPIVEVTAKRIAESFEVTNDCGAIVLLLTGDFIGALSMLAEWQHNVYEHDEHLPPVRV